MPKFSVPKNKKKWETPDHYINSYTGEILLEKPEMMTHLYENILVNKNEPRIIFRGRMDTLQAEIINAQVYFYKIQRSDMVSYLEELLEYARKILGSEVLNQKLQKQNLFGFNEQEIKNRSHFPEKYFGLKQMVLVSYKLGETVALLNLLRAKVREIELIAVECCQIDDSEVWREIILGLNRMSSSFHILMYEELEKII